MVIHLPFLAAVTLAGLAYLLGQTLIERIPLLARSYLPEPLLGGLLVAVGLLLLRQAGLVVDFPTHGGSLDFLIGLLTTNMGLHVSPKVLREGYRLFFAFLGAAALLFVVQLALVLLLPLAWQSDLPLRTAILLGPLSFVGAPFNLNPPDQTAPVQALLAPVTPQVEETAQAMMMVGVVATVVLSTLLGHLLFRRAGRKPPVDSPSEHERQMVVWRFASHETALIVLVLTIITLAFAIQDLLLQVLPWFRVDYLPVILLSYLLGAAFRLLATAIAGPKRFPEEALTVLLLGPTMGIVLTYAIMSVPLHLLQLVTPPMLLAAALAISGSVVMAWLAFPLFARLTDRYYAAVIATAFLAVTTAWGPIGMAYLRRFTHVRGMVEPMPVILPVNAFYLFPWLAIGLTHLLVLAGG